MATIDSITVHGLGELLAKLDPSLVSGPMHRFFNRSVLTVKGRAQDNVPRFDGHLANSIEAEVDTARLPQWGRVGSNAEHALPVEMGSRPHFPPVSAITPWAEAHGIAPFAVAVGISRHGTKAQPFMVPALENSRSEIAGYLHRAASEIEAENAI
jgi:hypothetical protein